MRAVNTEPTTDSLVQLRRRLAQFAAERDWQQFHSPKNLAMALIAEAAELVEHFQWLSEEQSANLNAEKLAEVRLELADILIYLIRGWGKFPDGVAFAVLIMNMAVPLIDRFTRPRIVGHVEDSSNRG